MKKSIVCSLLVFAAVSGFAADNPQAFRQSVAYSIRDSADLLEYKYIQGWAQIPSVMTFVNDDGTVTVCAGDENAQDTYIYEYSRDMKLLKTYKFHNEMEKLGAFTKDSAGNYYFFYAQDVKDGEYIVDHEDPTNGTIWALKPGTRPKDNMALVKYDASGRRQKIRTYAPDGKDGYGVGLPFNSGNCKLEISGSLIAVHFSGVELFSIHQRNGMSMIRQG
jgi:hypothetical protein